MMCSICSICSIFGVRNCTLRSSHGWSAASSCQARPSETCHEPRSRVAFASRRDNNVTSMWRQCDLREDRFGDFRDVSGRETDWVRLEFLLPQKNREEGSEGSEGSMTFSDVNSLPFPPSWQSCCGRTAASAPLRGAVAKGPIKPIGPDFPKVHPKAWTWTRNDTKWHPKALINSMEGPRGPDKATYGHVFCDVWFGKAVSAWQKLFHSPVLGPERMVASWQSLSEGHWQSQAFSLLSSSWCSCMFAWAFIYYSSRTKPRLSPPTYCKHKKWCHRMSSTLALWFDRIELNSSNSVCSTWWENFQTVLPLFAFDFPCAKGGLVHLLESVEPHQAELRIHQWEDETKQEICAWPERGDV